jgi:hypothetical protein
LQFTNTSVATSAFVADDTYEDFPYRAAVPLTGVLATMTPDVVLSVSDAMSGSYAPVAECYAGGVYIYASAVPDAAITIPTIICWMGVSGMAMGSVNTGGGVPAAGGAFTGAVTLGGALVLSSAVYGDALPAAGTAGRIFFKKV